MASENSMIKNMKSKVSKIPGCCIKKLWSSAVNRDIDLLIVVYGLACFYEIKVPGQKPTSWQYNRLAFWAASGADTGWFDDVDIFIKHITKLIEHPSNPLINITKAQTWRALAAGNKDETSKR